MIVSRESRTEFPNSFLWENGQWENLTNNVDPFPEVTAAKRIDFEFERRDGLLVHGRVSLPVDYVEGERVPAIFWWPGTIEPGTVMDMGSTLDLLPTLVGLAGAEAPADRVLDGFDLKPALTGTGPSPRDVMFFYRTGELYAVRQGPYKAHFITEGEYGDGPPRTEHETPLLYHLGEDPGEKYDISGDHPEVIAEILLPDKVRKEWEDKWITAVEAAELTGYTSARFRQLALDGTIPAQKRGPAWFFDKKEVLAYAEKMERLGTAKHDPTRGQG